ncbi:MAG: hypothetical protein NTV33_00875 [Coprothermobacterota bacterium]|nr:hypothetical protein [Coprothermobacterota bacterium]
MDRSAWQIVEDQFPQGTPQEEQSRFLLRYAILAPSSHNTQPWKFSLQGTRIRIFTDPERWLKVADADQRELHISAGCALANLKLAALRFSFTIETAYHPEADGDLAVTVELSRAAGVADSLTKTLFPFITARHTNRDHYDGKEVDPQSLVALRDCAGVGGAEGAWVTDREAIERLSELVEKGDALQFAEPAYRKELADWMGQGVFGQPVLAAKSLAFLISHADVGHQQGETEKKLIQSASAFGVLGVETVDKVSQIKLGEAYETLALTAAKLGLALQPMNQGLTEVPAHLEELRTITGIKGIPQMSFRLGYAKPAEPQVRRALEDFL